MNLENLNVQELSLENQRKIEGGNPIALGALCIAAFALGYMIGRDLAN